MSAFGLSSNKWWWFRQIWGWSWSAWFKGTRSPGAVLQWTVLCQMNWVISCSWLQFVLFSYDLPWGILNKWFWIVQYCFGHWILFLPSRSHLHVMIQLPNFLQLLQC